MAAFLDLQSAANLQNSGMKSLLSNALLPIIWQRKTFAVLRVTFATLLI